MRQVQINQRQRANFENLIQSIEIEQTKEFGDVAVYYHLEREFGLIEIFDQAAGKRNQGVSVGFLTPIMAINRNVEPKSKRGILDWYPQTALPEITGVEAGVNFEWGGAR